MPATRKHLHVSKPRRRQRSVSLTTRASRCGVKNFVNVLKSLHPQVEDFFPVTKEYMEEYISVKRKQGSIKANSLDQYFQHIESYNMALGHDWEAEVFEPMMREVLEDLEKSEEKARAERKLIMGDDAMTGIEQHGQENHMMGDVDSAENIIGMGPSVPLVCFDTSHTPLIKLESTARVPLSNIDRNDISIAIRQVKDLVAKTRFPKRWGDVDTSTIYYRNESWHDSQHFLLADESAFRAFLTASIDSAEGLQLIVYAKRNQVTKVPLMIGTDIDQTTTPLPLAPLTPRKSPPRLSSSSVNNIDMISGSPTPSPTFQQVKAITIRSPSKIYKSNIAVTDGTTFENLLKFAIPKMPPPGKQFVLQSADGELEFMPEDSVRKVIYGMAHAEVIVRVEDVKDIDFSEF